MGADPLVPDLAAADKVVRKRRAPKHDFKDGLGKVFAHRHDNGGGWVADTAYVAPSAKVTRNAQVFGYAKIYDECTITGHSMVYGRAKLFDFVRVAQVARVLGNAVLSDTAQVEDAGVVTGNAQVLGSSRVSRRAIVSGDALLLSSYVYGPHSRGFAYVREHARLCNCRIYGLSIIEGDASLDGTTIRSATVAGSAKIIGGYLMSDTTWQESCFLDRTTDFGQLYRDRTEDDVLREITQRRSRFEHTSINSNFSGAGIYLHDNITLIGSNFNFYSPNQDGSNPDVRAFFEALDEQNVVFYNLERAQGVDDLRRYLASGTQPRPVTIPGHVPTAPVNAVPNLDLVRQRRLMRLEGE